MEFGIPNPTADRWDLESILKVVWLMSLVNIIIYETIAITEYTRINCLGAWSLYKDIFEIFYKAELRFIFDQISSTSSAQHR